MKKILPPVLLVLVLLVVYLATRGGDGEPDPPVSTTPETPAAEAPEASAPLADPGRSDSGVAGDPVAPAGREPEVPADEPAPAATELAPPVADADGRIWLDLEVVDVRGAGIPGAEIRLDGLRTLAEPGTHYLWGREPSSAVTGPDGRARVWYPPGVGDEGTTGFVSFVVTHPDYVTLRDSSFDVATGGGVLTLEQGAFLVVAGILPSGETPAGIVPVVSDEARVQRSDWAPMGEGRLSTGRIPPGAHAIWLSYRGHDGQTYHSAVTPFVLTAGEQSELRIELLPSESLVGRLDEAVPRPVADGTVLLNLSVGSAGGPRVRMMRPFHAPVQPDGTFLLPDLPTGSGEMIGACAGWVSSRVRAGDSEDDEPVLQTVEVPQRGAPFVLRMERAATLAVSVEDPDGRPLAGATVHVWPNVHWRIGYSQMFLGRSYQALSGSGGLAVVEDLVPFRQPFLVTHPEYEMALEPRSDPAAGPPEEQMADLRPGERTEVTVRMRRR